MTTQEDIKRWIDECLENDDKYMIVMVDTFDYDDDDYPIGFKTGEECMESYNNPGDMQRVREVYDLSMSIEDQLNETIAHHLPKDGSDD